MSAQATAGRTPWADLPAPLWEQIAAALPTPDVMALRQGWRGAAHLADARVRADLGEALRAELGRCVGVVRAAVMSAQVNWEDMLGEMGITSPDSLSGWLKDFMQQHGHPRAVCLLAKSPLQGSAGGSGLRCTFGLQPHGAGIAMFAAIRLAQPEGSQTVQVEAEQLLFVALDGSLLAEYSLDWEEENMWMDVRSVRLATTGFGHLQARPLSEAAAHFEALEAAAEAQPLRAADGRATDGLLLPAIHDAMLEPAF